MKTERIEKIKKLFEETKVIDFKTLGEKLIGRSQRSIFRDLSFAKYLTSYTHAGRFYTLEHIPKFNEDGIWLYQKIGFSTYGTLKETVCELIKSSTEGMMHKDFTIKLKIRVHNTLLELAKKGLICREKVDGKYIYVSIEKEKALEQLKKRRNKKEIEAKLLPEWLTIEVLIEIIKISTFNIAPYNVAIMLQKRGIKIHIDQVEQIFERFQIKKKQLLK